MIRSYPVQVHRTFYSLGIFIKSIVDSSGLQGERIISSDISELPSGLYTIRAITDKHSDGKRHIQTIRFVKAE